MIKYLVYGIAILLIVLLFFRWYFGVQKLYTYEVKNQKELLDDVEVDLITESDLEDMPLLLQTYLVNVGVIGQPRVKYFHVTMDGEFRMEKGQDFSPCQIDQYTFIETGTRLFYMTMKYHGITINGIHHYDENDALMRIKILDLVKVVDEFGDKMHRAETVTYFNDLCIMAPGALIEEDIQWEELGENSVRGTITKHGNQVSAVLTFNDEGMLVDFVSEDRMIVSEEKETEVVPWSTPMTEFGDVGLYYLPKVGEAIWQYPNEEFSYIRLNIEDVVINGD